MVTNNFIIEHNNNIISMVTGTSVEESSWHDDLKDSQGYLLERFVRYNEILYADSLIVCKQDKKLIVDEVFTVSSSGYKANSCKLLSFGEESEFGNYVILKDVKIDLLWFKGKQVWKVLDLN